MNKERAKVGGKEMMNREWNGKTNERIKSCEMKWWNEYDMNMNLIMFYYMKGKERIKLTLILS